jgi:hypothetical protein
MSTNTTMQEFSEYESTTAASRVLRRLATAVAGFVAGIVGVFAIAPAAFAMRLPPPGSDGSGSPTYAHGLIQSANAAARSVGTSAAPVTSAHGMGAGEITLIVAAGVVLVSLLTVLAVTLRSRITHFRGAPA